MSRCYIAGPMRGLPLYNFPAFDAAKERLTAAGHEVVSPADLDRQHGWVVEKGTPGQDGYDVVLSDIFDYENALAFDMEVIDGCSHLALLEGWERSAGARRELLRALEGELVIIPTPCTPSRPEPVNERAQLLRRAEQLVCRERNNTYGDPDQDFQRIAAMWSLLFGREFKSHEVAMAMICLKLSRLSWSPGHQDSWDDCAGYSACGWETVVMAEERTDG